MANTRMDAPVSALFDSDHPHRDRIAAEWARQARQFAASEIRKRGLSGLVRTTSVAQDALLAILNKDDYADADIQPWYILKEFVRGQLGDRHSYAKAAKRDADRTQPLGELDPAQATDGEQTEEYEEYREQMGALLDDAYREVYEHWLMQIKVKDSAQICGIHPNMVTKLRARLSIAGQAFTGKSLAQVLANLNEANTDGRRSEITEARALKFFEILVRENTRLRSFLETSVHPDFHAALGR